MKNLVRIILPAILLTASLLIQCSSSDDDNDDLPPLLGEEDQLQGDWWNSDLSDGVNFDGSGEGYDLSYDGYAYCIDIDDPLYYRFDGTNLTIYEDGDVTSGTWEAIDQDSGTFTVEGTPYTFTKETTSGNCD